MNRVYKGGRRGKTPAPAAPAPAPADCEGVWVPCRTRAGVITGYVEMFRGPGGKLFTVPGASRLKR